MDSPFFRWCKKKTLSFPKKILLQYVNQRKGKKRKCWFDQAWKYISMNMNWMKVSVGLSEWKYWILYLNKATNL